MSPRRAIPGLTTRPPLRDDAEYRSALAELHSLGHAALGTPATRGLQALVDCILEYEAKQALALSRQPSTPETNVADLPLDNPETPGRLG